MSEFLTVEKFLEFAVQPLEEDVEVPELGGKVHVKGIATYAERTRIIGEINGLTETAEAGRLKITHPVSKEEFTPDSSDIVTACYAAVCVTNPVLSSYQWLTFAGQGKGILARLYSRCLICSRMMEDTDAGKTVILDGMSAAEAALENDPTSKSSSRSVLTN